MDELCEHCGKPSTMMTNEEQVVIMNDSAEPNATTLPPPPHLPVSKPEFYCRKCQEVCYCSDECMTKDRDSHADFCSSPKHVNWKELGKMLQIGVEKKIPCVGEPPNAIPIIFIPGPLSVLDPSNDANHWTLPNGKRRPESIPKAFHLIASDPQANAAYNLHVNETLGGQLFYYVVKYKDFPRAVMRQLSPRQQEELGEISKTRSREIARDKLRAAAPQAYMRPSKHEERSKLAKDKKKPTTNVGDGKTSAST